MIRLIRRKYSFFDSFLTFIIVKEKLQTQVNLYETYLEVWRNYLTLVKMCHSA